MFWFFNWKKQNYKYLNVNKSIVESNILFDFMTDDLRESEIEIDYCVDWTKSSCICAIICSYFSLLKKDVADGISNFHIQLIKNELLGIY